MTDLEYFRSIWRTRHRSDLAAGLATVVVMVAWLWILGGQ